MKLLSCTSILTACLLGGILGSGALAEETSAKQDIKDAGKSTKSAAKKVGHKTKQKSKKVVNKASRKVEEGADKVERKTEP